MEYDEIGDLCARLPVLNCIRDSEGEVRQRDICKSLNHSKSTTHRKVNRLSEMGLINKQGAGYELTALGEIAVEKLDDCIYEIRGASKYEEFLEVVGDSGLSVEDLRDSEVTRATQQNRFLPQLRLAEAVEGVNDCKVLTNSIAPQGFAVGRERVRNRNMSLEIVLDSDMDSSVDISRWYGEGFEEDLRSGNLSFWVHDDVPYRIGVLDDKFVMGSEDENGIPDAFLETDNPAAVEWAENEFESFVEEAVEVTPDEFD